MTPLVAPLTMWMGPTVPVPPPPSVSEAMESVEVRTSDEGRSGFQITFRAGRGLTDVLDYDLLSSPQLRPFSRVLLVVTFNAMPHVLMDGIITNQQLSPGQEPGTSTFTITGEDVSVMMDLEEKSVEHPAQSEMVIALKIIATYARYSLIPAVFPPPSLDVPIPTERTPTQQATDLQYLQQMAERFGYVFYVTPGPAPLTNTAYWGPPERIIPQRALSINVGPQTNVDSINFTTDALAPEIVTGSIQDRRLNAEVPVQTFTSTRIPLTRERPMPPNVRTTRMRASGLDTVQAFGRAQGRTDASMDRVVTATGELDSLRYEGVLRPRALVGVRGVGDTFGGMYYVKDVSHSIRRGSYKQSFTLTREGTGALVPVVIP